MKSLTHVLDDCQKAVRTVFTKGTRSGHHIRDIAAGRKALLGFIRELSSEKNPPCLRAVRAAFEELHPTAHYTTAAFIRDIADVCVTLANIELDLSPPEMKAPEAILLCQHLRNELQHENRHV